MCVCVCVRERDREKVDYAEGDVVLVYLDMKNHLRRPHFDDEIKAKIALFRTKF